MKVKAFLLLCALASWLTVSISLGSIFLFLVKLVLPRRLFVVLCRRVQAAYLAPFVYIIERYANVTLRQTGDALPQDESALILPNHLNQDWAPLYCLAYRCHMLDNVGCIGGIRCVLKNIYKYIPGFGVSMMLVDFLFLKRKWDVDQRYLESKLQAFRDDRLPLHLWIFPEGTRFTAKKHAEGEAFAKERGLKPLENCLQPRVKGFVAMAKGLQGICSHVYDVTLQYQGFDAEGEHNGPGLLDLFATDDKKHVFHVHVKRIAMDSLPTSDKELSEWCYKMFSRKDELLKQYAKQTSFPGEVQPTQRIALKDWLPGFAAFSLADFIVLMTLWRKFCA